MLEARLLMNTVFPESLQNSFHVSAAMSKSTQRPVCVTSESDFLECNGI